MNNMHNNMKWHVWLLSMLGHWEWEHEFKTCPTGDRHCQHYHWRPGKGRKH
jgi:hypothetical protein